MSNPMVSASDFVNVSVNISPTAVPYSLFGLPIIAGDSGVIDVAQRFRSYANINGVAQDFGTTAPEYLAAEVFFSQSPQPSQLYIGRWARTATAGLLHGASLSAAQQIALLASLQAITSGSFHVSVDGVAHDITGLNFSAVLNLNGAASVIQTALDTQYSSSVKCVWGSNNSRFDIVSATTGATSSVSYASTVSGTGTDVSTLLGLTAAAGASPPVAGIAAETPLACATALANASQQWYGLTFAASVMPSAPDYEAVAAYIEASSRARIFGVTIQTSDCLDPTSTGDLASALKALNLSRTFWYYDANNPYAVVTMMGRAFTVNFNAANSTITLAYKQAPGLTASYLTETQFATMQTKGGNALVAVDNGSAMIYPGQMTNGRFFDEVHNLDWAANRVQTDIFNLLYQSQTKIPQTDAGNGLIGAVISSSCDAMRNNGMVAPGAWNGGSFGSVNTGDVLSKGYYIYWPPIATQSQADREARKSVPYQVAIKLAGADHTVDAIINVNR